MTHMNIIVITGASSGMGREFALQLDRGLLAIDEFWLVARRAERMKELAAIMRHRVKILPLDLSFESDLVLFKEMLAEEKPAVRMLINCAGYGMIGDFSDIPIEKQAGEVDVNCRALIWTTHACLAYMRKNSRIIQLSSSAAFLPQPGFSVYAATKAFVQSFSMALGKELSDREIYVTAVCPGPVRTEFFDIAEGYGDTLAIKKYTMVEADRVVRDALKASGKKRAMSVCSLPIQTFAAISRLLPHKLLIDLTWRMKRNGSDRSARSSELSERLR